MHIWQNFPLEKHGFQAHFPVSAKRFQTCVPTSLLTVTLLGLGLWVASFGLGQNGILGGGDLELSGVSPSSHCQLP